MKPNHPAIRWLALSAQLAALGILAACNLPQPQADTVRHFTLSAPSAAKPAADPVTVRAVRLAGHLRSRAMAIRVSENEVVYLEDIRWAEALDEAITQLLRNRLRPIGGGAVVNVFIQRCELVQAENNQVQLNATYTISVPGQPARTAVFTASERRWDGKDQAVLVGLIRDAVNELGDTIAGALGGG